MLKCWPLIQKRCAASTLSYTTQRLSAGCTATASLLQQTTAHGADSSSTPVQQSLLSEPQGEAADLTKQPTVAARHNRAMPATSIAVSNKHVHGKPFTTLAVIHLQLVSIRCCIFHKSCTRQHSLWSCQGPQSWLEAACKEGLQRGVLLHRLLSSRCVNLEGLQQGCTTAEGKACCCGCCCVNNVVSRISEPL
jgi:hypothetical protein